MTTLAPVVAGAPHVAAHNDERTEINRIAGLFGTNITLESLQDAVAAMIVAGTNVTATYDDTTGTITISSTGGSGGSTDPEVVRDTIAAALVAGTNVSITVNDAVDTITINCTSPALPATGTGDEGKSIEVNSLHTGYQLGVRKSPAAYPISGTTEYAPQGLTKWYNPLDPSYGLSKDQMSGWRLSQGKARSGKGLSNLYFLGDSGAAGFFGKNTTKPNDPANAHPNVLKDILLASGVPWGGSGFVSPSQNLLSTDAGDKVDPRWTFGNAANWDCHKYGLYATSTTSGETATLTAEQEGGTDVYIVVDNAKPAMNYTIRNSAGTIISGPTSTAPAGGSTLKMIHVGGLTDARSVTLTTLGSTTNFIYPVCIAKSSGFMLHNFSFVAAIGAGASGWENTGNIYNGANKVAQLCATSLAIDLLMIQLGGNDEFNAYTYPVITTGIANLFAQFTAPSKIFVMHAQAASWSDSFMATSVMNYWQMCEDNNLGMIDTHAISGGYTKMYNAGIMEDLTGGQTHPNQVLAFTIAPVVAHLLGIAPNLENLQDTLARSIVAGSNISISYDDTTGLLTINSSGGGGGGVGFTAAPAWAPSHAYTAGDFVRLPTGGIGYRLASSTSAATWTPTERDAWQFIAGGHYELDRTVGATSWKAPNGIYNLLNCKLKGSGGSGGGAGSAAASQLQGGAGGGGACAPFEFSAAVTPGTTYAVSIGASKTGGAGGAAGGNNGTAGTTGDDTTITIAGVTYTSKGGAGGGRSTASSTAAGGGGAYGFGAALTQAFGALYPGFGAAGATGAVPLGEMIGGGGGTSATATLGGLGGAARTAPGGAVATVTGNSGTAAGQNGTNATEDGCGGGGGGGGAAGTGKGGDGGSSGQGRAEYWF